jgi:hypothetical protein
MRTAGAIQLAPDELSEINTAVASITVQGERLPLPVLDLIDR